MKNLLYKELRLALHPTNFLFLGLSALLLIPNYPYFVTFFYTCLGVFFLCLNGRENRDIYYSLLLPVRKRQIVQARFLSVLLLELAQLLTALPFALVRLNMQGGNLVGMNPNAAFFGIAFLLFGLFHYGFFTTYYKGTDRVGLSFFLGCIPFVLVMLLAEVSTHVFPFMKNVLNTTAPDFLLCRLAVLFLGAALWLLLTALAYRKSVRTFEKLDF